MAAKKMLWVMGIVPVLQAILVGPVVQAGREGLGPAGQEAQEVPEARVEDPVAQGVPEVPEARVEDPVAQGVLEDPVAQGVPEGKVTLKKRRHNENINDPTHSNIYFYFIICFCRWRSKPVQA
jgi:hypothetical protein